jgi:hypothetical protein
MCVWCEVQLSGKTTILVGNIIYCCKIEILWYYFVVLYDSVVNHISCVCDCWLDFLDVRRKMDVIWNISLSGISNIVGLGGEAHNHLSTI